MTEVRADLFAEKRFRVVPLVRKHTQSDTPLKIPPETGKAGPSTSTDSYLHKIHPRTRLPDRRVVVPGGPRVISVVKNTLSVHLCQSYKDIFVRSRDVSGCTGGPVVDSGLSPTLSVYVCEKETGWGGTQGPSGRLSTRFVGEMATS